MLSELHWADDLMLALIDELLERATGLPVFIMATARPELEDRWMPKPGRYNVVNLHLDPLDAGAASRLLATMIESPLPTRLREELLERSGGNPFFLEELVALLAEAGVLETEWDLRSSDTGFGDLPATLRGLVAARIDGLSPASRSTLEDAAVIGPTGAVGMLESLAEARGEPSPTAPLDDLANRDLISIVDGEWSFRSDVVRQVAYDTLTKAERARRHARIGEWLADARGPGREDEDFEMMAHHFACAAEITIELGAIDGVPTRTYATSHSRPSCAPPSASASAISTCRPAT